MPGSAGRATSKAGIANRGEGGEGGGEAVMHCGNSGGEAGCRVCSCSDVTAKTHNKHFQKHEHTNEASDDATGQPEDCLAFNSICRHQMAAQGLVRPPVALCFAVVR